MYASLVIGTDGVHSTVRQYDTPDLCPLYMGSMTVATASKNRDVWLPESMPCYHLPVSNFGKPSVFVLGPQDVDGSELLTSTQIKMPELDQARYQEISNTPEKMISLLKRNYDDWFGCSAIRHG